MSIIKVKNASQLARHVMESEHTMIVGEGATIFAQEKGLIFHFIPNCCRTGSSFFFLLGMELVEETSLITEYEKEHLKNLQNYKPAVKSIFGDQSGHDTVGAVALDQHGNFAACTSTGGVTYKRVGRVGDSPLPGSGAWAEDIGACSTTGHGEGITKALLAHRVVQGMS